MNRVRAVAEFIWGAVFGYETQKVVQIHSRKIGAFFRLIQFGIILYVILWVMWAEKGYQDPDSAVSGVTAKFKGVGFANEPNDPRIGKRIWDAADYVIPPQQKDGFFVMTNLVLTPNQSIGSCPEDPEKSQLKCNPNDTNNICKNLKDTFSENGIYTGKCVPIYSSRKANYTHICEVYGWCPVEHDNPPTKQNLLRNARDFTVMLKNSIEFPKYSVKRRNILPWMSKDFLRNCRFEMYHELNKYCPIFRLGDILKYTDADEQTLLVYGGMVSIQIEWNCDLDFGEDACLPNYKFSHLDYIQGNKSDVAGKGWNFRFSQHFRDSGENKRNLIKAYGIQFFITVYGKGGKFNLFNFSMNLGSGLALLGLATVFCDMIILNTTRNRTLYRKARVDTVAENKTDFNKIKREFLMKRHHLMKKISSHKFEQSNDSLKQTFEDVERQELAEWGHILVEVMGRDKLSEILDMYTSESTEIPPPSPAGVQEFSSQGLFNLSTIPSPPTFVNDNKSPSLTPSMKRPLTMTSGSLLLKQPSLKPNSRKSSIPKGRGSESSTRSRSRSMSRDTDSSVCGILKDRGNAGVFTKKRCKKTKKEDHAGSVDKMHKLFDNSIDQKITVNSVKNHGSVFDNVPNGDATVPLIITSSTVYDYLPSYCKIEIDPVNIGKIPKCQNATSPFMRTRNENDDERPQLPNHGYPRSPPQYRYGWNLPSYELD